MNFGDLPTIVATTKSGNCSAVVYAGGTPSLGGLATFDGVSPFVADIAHAEVSAEFSTAEDRVGVAGADGLHTGIFGFDTGFTIVARDKYGNRVYEGPLAEVQVVETWAQGGTYSSLAGSFELSFAGATATIPAGAGPADVEGALEALPSVGAVTVTTHGVNDLVAKRTVLATFGSDKLVPSADLAGIFEEGDWIRVGGGQRIRNRYEYGWSTNETEDSTWARSSRSAAWRRARRRATR